MRRSLQKKSWMRNRSLRKNSRKGTTMKNNTHCGSEFPGMNEFSGVKINADEVRAVVKKFERELKSGRVFFPGDAPFAMSFSF